MSIRIRVYPQGGAYGRYGGMGLGGYGGYGGYGSYGVQNRLLAQKLQQQKQTSALRLAYERQLWAQQLQMTQLQAQVQYGAYNPYARLAAMSGVNTLGTYGMMNPMLSTGTGFFGSLGLGGLL